jgi:hypothetical protein
MRKVLIYLVLIIICGLLPPSCTSTVTVIPPPVTVTITSTPDKPAKPTPTTSPIEITVAGICQVYEDNQVAGDVKFWHKTIAVTGTVSAISTTSGDAFPIVTLSEGLWTVTCRYRSHDHDEKVASWRKGDSVTIIGTCTGHSGNVGVDVP